jgi:hypothetical protein
MPAPMTTARAAAGGELGGSDGVVKSQLVDERQPDISKRGPAFES